MTNGDWASFRARQMLERRNLKRYWFSQGFRRISGDRCAGSRFRGSGETWARVLLVILAGLLLGTGFWSVFF